MKKVALLVSSGVESACLLRLYLSEGFLLYPVYVRSGAPWEEVEIRWLRRLWSYYRREYGRILPFRIVPLRAPQRRKVVRREEGLEIPLRNWVLTTATALYALEKGVSRIAVGSLGIYPFPDNSREYYDRMEELLSKGSKRRIEIDTPFMGVEKWEIVRRFYGSVPFELTFSCVNPVGDEHCGRCVKCLERKEGFLKAGVPDPTCYSS